MFYIIGVGLCKPENLTFEAIEAIKRSNLVYIESYTSKLYCDFKELSEFLRKEVIVLNREDVEAKDLFFNSSKKVISFLVIGSPLFATTHLEFIAQAKDRNTDYKVIDNVSIHSVIGAVGLYAYNFGRTVSIPFFTDTFKPLSLFDKIYINYSNNMHTLCLLDIKADENRFMDPKTAINNLLFCEKETNRQVLKDKIFVISRYGYPNQKIYYDKIDNLLKMDFGGPLHSLIIPSEIDENEKDLIMRINK